MHHLDFIHFHLKEVDTTILTAKENEIDFRPDVQTVAVDNCGVATITVFTVEDFKIEGQGIEAFLLSIQEDAAYTIGKPSIATVYIKGTVIKEHPSSKRMALNLSKSSDIVQLKETDST